MGMVLDSIDLKDTVRLTEITKNLASGYNEIELSTLPQSLLNLLEKTRDEKSWKKEEIVGILNRDPSLVERILRVANSALYAQAVPVTTVKEAIGVLGIRAVRAHALAVSIYDMTRKWELGLDRRRFWKHSLQVAIAARKIAEFTNYKHPAEAYICGLLHDIGLLLLEKTTPGDFVEIWRQLEKRVVSYQEEMNWRSFHADVGKFFLKKWNLPQSICDAVGSHHDGTLADHIESKTHLNRIVLLANLISPFTIRNEPVLKQDLRTTEVLKKGFGLSQDNLNAIIKYLMKKTKEESAFLDKDICSQDNILTEINRIYYKHYLTTAVRLFRKRKRNVSSSELEKQKNSLLEANAKIFQQYLKIEKELAHNKTLLTENDKSAWPEIKVDPTKVIVQKYLELQSTLDKYEKQLLVKNDDSGTTNTTEPYAGYAIARFPELDPYQCLIEGNLYLMEMEILDYAPEDLKTRKIKQHKDSNTLNYEIMVHAEDIEILEDWVRSYKFQPGSKPNMLQYHLKPMIPGNKRIQINVLFNNYWMAKIVFEFEVLPREEQVAELM